MGQSPAEHLPLAVQLLQRDNLLCMPVDHVTG
jgi:hypothetical protein